MGGAIDCTESQAAPLADAVIAGALAFGAIAVASTLGDEWNNVGNMCDEGDGAGGSPVFFATAA